MAVTISNYNYNYSPYENLKANLISDKMARNRWGKKFARLYKKHSPLEALSPTYDFTSGMRAITGDLNSYNAALEEYTELKEMLSTHLKVKDEEGHFSFTEALKSSFISVALEVVYPADECYIDCIDYKCTALSFTLSSQSQTDDGKLVSYLSVDVEDNSSVSIVKLEPMENAEDNYGLRLYADNDEYGHYSINGIKELNYSDTLLAYTVDDKEDEHFSVDQASLFSELWGEKEFGSPVSNKLGAYLFKMALESETVHSKSVTVGDTFSVLFSLGQLMDDLTETIEGLNVSIVDEENRNERTYDDIKLIEHLEMEDVLVEEVTRPHKIKSLWYKLEKELKNPQFINTSTDENVKTWEVDPEWKWWEEESFRDISENFKKFREHIYLNIVEDDNGEAVALYAQVKLSALDLAGWKIFWLVSAFLDVEVRAKKASFLKRLFSLAMLVVAIYLTVVSGNPTWLKIVLVATTVLSHFGVLSPKVQLAVAILSMSYTALTTNVATMSSMQMFKFAIGNINMIYNMLELYEGIKLKEQSQEEEKPTHEMQNEAIEYIYTDAYSQYDDMYNLLYNYSPNYK